MIDTGYIREKILDLAVSGELVDQNPLEGDARDLLAEIKAEKEDLIKAKKIRKEKALAEIRDDEIPFEIPESWVWVKLGEVTNYGLRPKIKSENIPDDMVIVELEDINSNNNSLIMNTDRKKVSSTKNIFYSGDVLYGKLRPYLKKCVITDFNGCCSTEIIPFRGYSNISSKFLLNVMMSPYINLIINNLSYGVNMPRLGIDDAKNLPIPLPPLSEQERIVERIEEAFDLLDEIEKSQTDLINLADQLKSKVLDSAMKGKLVPQDSNDESVESLLAMVEQEKERLIKSKKIRKEKPLDKLKEEDLTYDIPSNWIFVKLGDISNVGSGTTPSTKFITKEGVIPFIKVSDMNNPKNDIVMTEFENFLSSDYDKKTIPYPSIIFPKNGGAIYTNKKRIVTEESLVDLNTGYVNPIIIDLKFVFYYLLNIDLAKHSSGSSVPTINSTTLKNLPFPLPPLEEQKRIVEKIEDIFTAIDTMLA